MIRLVQGHQIQGIHSDRWFVVSILQEPIEECNVLTTGEFIHIRSDHSTKGSADKSFRKLKQQFNVPDNKSNKLYTYQLLLTPQQAKVIIAALDLYSRIGQGQLQEIAQVVRKNDGIPTDRIDAVTSIAREAASTLMINFGIFSDKLNDVFRVAWDLQQVIRNRLAWDHKPTGGIQVDFDNPVRSSKEPLAVIQKL